MTRVHKGSRLSTILLRYVSGEMAVPFSICLLGLLGLFVVSDSLDAQQDWAEAGLTGGQILLYLLLRQPSNLIHVLPMSVLLGVAFTVSTMGRRHEITAIRSSGVSLTQFGTPFWALGVLCAAATFLLSEFTVPPLADSLQELRTSPGEATQRKEKDEEHLLAFRNRSENRDWLFERFDKAGYGKGVLVKQYRKDGTIWWELHASSARYFDGVWEFRNGTFTTYRMHGGFPEPVERQSFEVYSRPGLDDEPRSVAGTMRPTEHLSVRGMVEVLSHRELLPERTHDILATTVWYRCAYPFTCVMCALVSVGLGVRTERAGGLAGFAAAVGVIFLFYGVSEFFVLLGRTGRIPPPVAGVLPVAGFTLWGGWRVYRRR